MRKISTTPQYLNVNGELNFVPAEILPPDVLHNSEMTKHRFHLASRLFYLKPIDNYKVFYFLCLLGSDEHIGYATLSNTDANGKANTRRTSIPAYFQESMRKIKEKYGDKPYICLGETDTYLLNHDGEWRVNNYSYSAIFEKECEKSKDAVRETGRVVSVEDVHNVEQYGIFCPNKKENAFMFSKELLDSVLLKVFNKTIIKDFEEKTFEPRDITFTSLYLNYRKHTLEYQGKATNSLDEIPLEIIWFFKSHLYEKLTKKKFVDFVNNYCPSYQKSYEETIEIMQLIMDIHKIKSNFVVVSEYMSTEYSSMIDNTYELTSEKTVKKENRGYVNEALTIGHLSKVSTEELKGYFDLDVAGNITVKSHGREQLYSSVVNRKIYTKIDAILETLSGLKKISIKIDDGKTSYAHSTNIEDFIKCFKYLYGEDIINQRIEKILYLLFGAKNSPYERIVSEFKGITQLERKECYLIPNELRLIDSCLYEEFEQWLNLHSSKILKYILLQGNMCDDTLLPDYILYSNFYDYHKYGYILTKEQIINYCNNTYIDNVVLDKDTKYTNIYFSWGHAESKDGRMMFHFNHKKWLELSGEEMKVIDFLGDAMQENA